jgi:hypothetical protein
MVSEACLPYTAGAAAPLPPQISCIHINIKAGCGYRGMPARPSTRSPSRPPACLPAFSAPPPACLQYSSKHDGEEGAAAASDELLICGWMGNTFMWELLAELDHSDPGDWGWGCGLGVRAWGGGGAVCTLAALWCKMLCAGLSRVSGVGVSSWVSQAGDVATKVCAAWLTPPWLQALPAGSRVTLFNDHPWTPDQLGEGLGEGSSWVRGSPRLSMCAWPAAHVTCFSCQPGAQVADPTGASRVGSRGVGCAHREPSPCTCSCAQSLSCAEERCRQHDINSLDVRHVVGDPRSRAHMKRLVDVTKFKAAFVVCGEWACVRLVVCGGFEVCVRLWCAGGWGVCWGACMLARISAARAHGAGLPARLPVASDAARQQPLCHSFVLAPAQLSAADSSWAGSVAPNADGGLQLLSHSDMLGLDAAVLTIQLNLRQLLEVGCCAPVQPACLANPPPTLLPRHRCGQHCTAPLVSLCHSAHVRCKSPPTQLTSPAILKEVSMFTLCALCKHTAHAPRPTPNTPHPRIPAGSGASRDQHHL